jgi:hypothetical protein
MKILFLSYILAISGIFCLGCDAATAKEPASNAPSHQRWNELLKTHVSESGNVNYKAFIKDKDKFEQYLSLIKNSHPNKQWSKDEQMAYWINAYNAFTVKLILDNWPVKNIKNIGGAKSPWDIEFIKIKDKTYTLNAIEHEILRKDFNDPRIHFAVNCASISCPKLLNEAYTAEKLDQQLTARAKDFINRTSKNSIQQDKIIISKIFKWYKEDFTQNGTLIDYINQYSNIQINKNAKIEYNEYNWSLNN